MMKTEGKGHILSGCVFICMILYGAVNVLLAFCLKNMVDAAVMRDMASFFQMVLFTLFIAVFELCTGVLSRFLLQLYCRHKLIWAKSDYYQRVFGADNIDPNDISAFSADVDVLYTNYFLNQGMIVCQLAQLVFSTVSIVFLSWKISLVVLIFTFLPFLSPVLFKKRLQRETENYTNASKDYLAFVQDSLNGMQEVRTYRAFDFFYERHNILNRRAESCRLKNKMWLNVNSKTAAFFGTLSFVATIAACGYLTIKGETTIGTLIAVTQLINTVVGPVGTIAGELGEMKSAKKLLQRYKKPEGSCSDSGKTGYISRIDIRNMGFSYEHGRRILENFNLKLEHGKRYAVIGESGGGKSTFAKILAGALKCDAGSIAYIDEKGQKVDVSRLSDYIQYVSQEPYVFRLTAEENVYFGKPEEDGQMLFRMKQLGIDHIFQDGERILSNRDYISGGQKQRLVIARALSHRPDVLILDEPTANLDSKTARRIMEYILAADYGILIVITHDTSREMLFGFDEVIRIS